MAVANEWKQIRLQAHIKGKENNVQDVLILIL